MNESILLYFLSESLRLELVPRHSDVVLVVQCTAPDVSQDIAGFCQLVIQRMLAASSF